MIRKDNST